MRNHQPASGERQAGGGFRGKIQRREVVPDQCADESEVLCPDLGDAGEDADHQFLQYLPGYGYAKVSEKEKAQWGKLVERYLHGSSMLKAVFLLIDIRHVPSANDRMMYEWILDKGFQPIMILTKLDKLKRSQVQKQIKVVKEGLKLVPGTRVIPFSSVTKQGREEIWEVIESFLEQEEAEQ